MDNLVSNALKYSAFDKKVYLTVERDENEGMWACRVRDEGPGINPGDLGGLFKQGIRLGHTPTGGEPSTGYGLAVAKELVERMGGRIWCESEAGVGSTFSFTVPVYKGEADC
jgi:signal transduction histidine kinase